MLALPKLHFALAAAVLVAVVGGATAAVSLAYSSSSSGASVKQAPIVFEPGADAAFTDYVPSFALSPNATSFSMTLRGIPEVPVAMTDLLRIKNVDARPHTVTLATAQVANAFVSSYKLEFYDGATHVGTLDLKAPNPSVSFAMPPGKTYTAQATIALASGAGLHNVADQRALQLIVTA